jgi:hypothetical protein
VKKDGMSTSIRIRDIIINCLPEEDVYAFSDSHYVYVTLISDDHVSFRKYDKISKGFDFCEFKYDNVAYWDGFVKNLRSETLRNNRNRFEDL